MMRRRERITIHDLAKELGVTITTVSRALNDKPDVAPATRSQVMQVAERLGYVRSALGRGLASGRIAAVGCVVTTISDPFVARVLEGIEEAAHNAGYAVITATSQLDRNREIAAIDTFHAFGVAGIISTSSRVGASRLSRVVESGSPIVLINNEGQESFVNSVRVDDVDVARSVVAHLLDLGHRRIGHIKLADGSASGRGRSLGYRRALMEGGLRDDPLLVAEADDSEHGGAAAMERLLALSVRPTATFCYNDRIATGALAMLRRGGLEVPGDMSVVGVDDIEVAAWLSPPLTTVRQPAREMGQMAMEMVLKLQDEKPEIEDAVIQGQLIVRESTDVPRLT